MRSTTRLRLAKETVAELGADQLTRVGGAAPRTLDTCFDVRSTECVSEWIISMCGCFTNYCSIEVC